MKDLTTRQRELYEFIIKYQAEKFIIPSLPVMAEYLHVSVSRIQHIISALTRKKFIVRQNIYLIKSATEAGALPVRSEQNGNTSAESGPLNIN